jgi:uncharacterized phage-like protein YoqJ
MTRIVLERQVYADLIAQADSVHLVSNVQPKARAEAAKMLRHRNGWTVAQAAMLLAVWDGSPGGTAHTVESALARGLVVVALDPRAVERGWHKVDVGS